MGCCTHGERPEYRLEGERGERGRERGRERREGKGDREREEWGEKRKL